MTDALTAADVKGHCDDRFDALRETFAANFSERHEVGASLAVVIEGEVVVDLWGGFADLARTQPWQRDTIVNVYSSTKGIAALAGAMLAERGQLDYTLPVAAYWPEFARAGKEGALVSHLFSHQVGVPSLPDEFPYETQYDWQAMVAWCEEQTPDWEPGSAMGYHPMTYGWLVGEVIRRVAGMSTGAFVRQEITDPLGIDFFIGTPASEDGRIAEMLRSPEAPKLVAEVNGRGWRGAELPAANGHGNARALATIYGALARGGEINGVKLIGREAIERAGAEHVRAEDRTLGFDVRRGLGYIVNTPGGRYDWGPNLRTFGHSGAGGSLGFADPDAHIGVGYAMNMMRGGMDMDPRWKPMIDALYEIVGAVA